jgi:hypothetical protein
MHNCRLLLELPIQRNQSTARWPRGTSRLLVYVPGAPKALERRAAFAEILAHLDRVGGHLWAHALGVLVDDRNLKKNLDSRGFGNLAVRLAESTWLFDCAAAEAVDYLLQERSFESVAFFWTADLDTARSVVLAASQAPDADRDRYETALLRNGERLGGFVFHSLGHDNLEFLGQPDFILRQCADALLPWAAEN